jgi:alanine-glyoxylate transaminase/serine-glyoxylate transaminase/serine-pyruvate transaminase
MLYGLHEALRLVLDEGLEARYQRHARLSGALCAGLQAMGLTLPVPEDERLPPLTLVEVPEGVDDRRLRAALLEHYQLEIGAGLGAFKNKALRIGLMGESCTERHVLLCLTALKRELVRQGFTVADDPIAPAASLFWG